MSNRCLVNFMKQSWILERPTWIGGAGAVDKIPGSPARMLLCDPAERKLGKRVE